MPNDFFAMTPESSSDNIMTSISTILLNNKQNNNASCIPFKSSIQINSIQCKPQQWEGNNIYIIDGIRESTWAII